MIELSTQLRLLSHLHFIPRSPHGLLCRKASLACFTSSRSSKPSAADTSPSRKSGATKKIPLRTAFEPPCNSPILGKKNSLMLLKNLLAFWTQAKTSPWNSFLFFQKPSASSVSASFATSCRSRTSVMAFRIKLSASLSCLATTSWACFAWKKEKTGWSHEKPIQRPQRSKQAQRKVSIGNAQMTTLTDRPAAAFAGALSCSFGTLHLQAQLIANVSGQLTSGTFKQFENKNVSKSFMSIFSFCCYHWIFVEHWAETRAETPSTSARSCAYCSATTMGSVSARWASSGETRSWAKEQKDSEIQENLFKKTE